MIINLLVMPLKSDLEWNAEMKTALEILVVVAIVGIVTAIIKALVYCREYKFFKCSYAIKMFIFMVVMAVVCSMLLLFCVDMLVTGAYLKS